MAVRDSQLADQRIVHGSHPPLVQPAERSTRRQRRHVSHLGEHFGESVICSTDRANI